MTIETKEDAKQRIVELTAQLVATSRGARRPLVLEQARLVALRASLPSRAQLEAAKAPKAAERKPGRKEAPPYVGPRCGFCGGEQPQGERCRNESEEWPHPPCKTPIKTEETHA